MPFSNSAFRQTARPKQKNSSTNRSISCIEIPPTASPLWLLFAAQLLATWYPGNHTITSLCRPLLLKRLIRPAVLVQREFPSSLVLHTEVAAALWKDCRTPDMSGWEGACVGTEETSDVNVHDSGVTFLFISCRTSFVSMVYCRDL